MTAGPGTPDEGKGRRSRATRQRSPDRTKAYARVIAAVVLTLIAVYAVRMAGLALDIRRAERSEAELASEVRSLQNEVTALQTAAADAETDAGVEAWAREERGWARAGDHTVAVLGTPRAAVVVAPTATPESALDRILRRLRQALP